MTSLDAASKLFEFFFKNDSFTLEDDFKNIVLVTEDKIRDSAAILLALGDYVKMDVLDKVEIEGKTVWVLKKPLASFEQSVKIGPALAFEISRIINEACEMVKDDTDRCNPCQIVEKDIINIMIMLGQAISIDTKRKNKHHDE